MSKYTPIIVTADSGSLTKAAQVLGYTQPNLGYTISRIEDELGVKLFHRDQRGMHLTAEGEALLPMMKQIDSLSEQIEDTAKYLQTGLIRIGIFSSPAIQWIPEIIRRFKETHPTTILKMNQNLSYVETEVAVKTHQIECSFYISSHVTGLDAIPLFYDRYCLVCSSKSPLAKLDSVTVDDIKGKYSFVHTSETFDPLSQIYPIARELDLNEVVALEPIEDQVAMSMVESDQAITILAELPLLKLSQCYDIKYIPFKEDFSRLVSLICPKASERSSLTNDFIKITLDVISDWKEKNAGTLLEYRDR